MSTSVHSNPPARTWRDIEQSIAPRAMSSEGRKRLMLGTVKSVCALGLLCFVGWGVYEGVRIWEDNPTALKTPVKSAPVKTITLRTDGVLDQAWVTRALALPKNAGLMELDLYALQARLLATEQVRAAVLARKFPDTLTIVIEERMPVARLMVQIAAETPKVMLVARDGVIFSGINHDPALISTLPFLDGVTLKRSGGSFQPLAGMESVAELLGTAHANIPALYRGWQMVSLARFAADGEIVVRSQDVREIIFSAKEDFYKQIAQLDLIVEEARLQPGGPGLRAVNLAVGGIQVPVTFEQPDFATPKDAKTPKPAAEPSAARRAPPQRPALVTFFNPSSREF